MSPGVKRLRERLTAMTLSQEQAQTIDRQIDDVVRLHVHRFSTDKPIREQMEMLARDASPTFKDCCLMVRSYQ